MSVIVDMLNVDQYFHTKISVPLHKRYDLLATNLSNINRYRLFSLHSGQISLTLRNSSHGFLFRWAHK